MVSQFGTVMRLFVMHVSKRAEHFLGPRNGGRRPKWSGRKLNTPLESTSVGSLRRARMFYPITPRDREPPGFRNDTGARPPQEPGGLSH
jgi:hypothetical protein